MPAAFEDVREAHQVAVHVGVGVDQRVAHAGLGGHVGDLVETLRVKQCLHPVAVGQIKSHEAEIVTAFQLRQPVALELRVVVVIDVVQPNDLVAARQQVFG